LSEEFNKALKDAKKGSAEEKIDALASIIGDMMHVILEMPGIFDEIVDELNEKIVSLDAKLNSLSNLQTSTDPLQMKQLKPPPAPIEEKKKPIQRERSVKQMIIDELKEYLAKKKEIEKKKAQCKNCENYIPINEIKGKCFEHEVLGTQAAEECPKKQFKPKNKNH